MLLSDLVDLIKKGNSNFISANIVEDLNIDDAASLDDGASFAIKKNGASLLAVGVKNVEGNFTVNQAVKIVNTNDKEVAKGLVSISSDKLRSILNNKENKNSSIIVVHRDVLALS